MSRLTDQYPNLARFLRDNLNDRARAQLDSPIVEDSNRALCAWLDDMHDDGTLVIPAAMSATGRPVLGTPED